MDPIPQDRDEKRFAIWSSKVNVTRKIHSSSSKTQISFAQKVLVRSSDTFLSSASDNQRYRSSLLIALKIQMTRYYFISSQTPSTTRATQKSCPIFPFSILQGVLFHLMESVQLLNYWVAELISSDSWLHPESLYRTSPSFGAEK